MTIKEAIDRVDELKPNGYTDNDKIEWLSKLDGMVKREVIDTHEGGEDIEFSGYTPETDVSTVLLVPYPYDDLYVKWLESKIDLNNGEYAKYNNAVTLFNSSFSTYANYYNKNHMPKGNRIRYF